jgi:beta-lactamase regulating signal transducer with metallopeptidase domain
MLPLQQILSQLGYAVICSIWQMGLLWLFYIIATTPGNPSPNNRFRLSLFLSILGTLWFLITLSSAQPSTALLQAYIFGNEAFAVSPQFLFSNWLLCTMGCLYLIILLYAGIKKQMQWKITMQNTHEDFFSKAPVALRLFVEKNAALLGFNRPVLLKISEVFSPSTYGFFKPVILLPISCLTQLNIQQIESLLLHELAHIRRNDFFWSVVLNIAEMVLYFNPFMRRLVQEARKECEHACDDMVVQFGYVPKDYALALLNVAKHGYAKGWALQASGAQQPLLLNRIARMLGLCMMHQKKYTGKNIFSFCAFVFCLGFSLIISNKKIVETKNDTIPALTLDHPLQDNEIMDASTGWKKILLETRKQIIKASIDKATAENETKNSAIRKAASEKELVKSMHQKEAGRHLIIKKSEIPASESASSPLFLSAGWAEQMGNPEAGLSAIEKGWNALTVLMEKLETEKFLEETEWEQLATLITFHSDIREMIYKETRKTQFGVINTSLENEIKDTSEKDILVIVYDEASGTLAASLMPASSINHEFDLPDFAEDKQKVMILRKWLNETRKVIRL